MEVRDYLRILRRSWQLILSCLLLGILTAGMSSLLMAPTYVAKTQLFVSIQSSGSVLELQQGNNFSQGRVESYVKTATTPAVLQPVVDTLGLDLGPLELAQKIEASADLNTVLIDISASDSSPVVAAAIAQAVAESLVNAVQELETSSPETGSPIRLSIITPATAPASPSSPNAKINILIGALGGGLVGLGAAFLRSVVDNKVRGATDLRRITKAPVLGEIAFDAAASTSPLIIQTPIQSPRAESFRQIRTNLRFAQINLTSKTILLTSSLPGEGKSTTAANMAIALSQTGQRVALIDADLRRPMVATYLGLERNAGLTTALLGTASVEDLLQPWGEHDLHVLTSGQIPPNPSELLGSEAMTEIIRKLECDFDVVIIDSPPLIPVTDAAVLAQKVGGVVLVVGAGKINAQDLEKSLATLDLVDAEVAGTVLNFLPTKGADAYAYSYSYSSHETQSESRRERSGRTTKSLNGSRKRAKRRVSGDTSFDDIVAVRH